MCVCACCYYEDKGSEVAGEAEEGNEHRNSVEITSILFSVLFRISKDELAYDFLERTHEAEVEQEEYGAQQQVQCDHVPSSRSIQSVQVLFEFLLLSHRCFSVHTAAASR